MKRRTMVPSAEEVEGSLAIEFTADAGTPANAAVFIDNAFWAAGAAIVTGDPGTFAGVACGPMLAIFSPVAGTTYRILIFDYADSGGGTATVRVGDVPPPPELGLRPRVRHREARERSLGEEGGGEPGADWRALREGPARVCLDVGDQERLAALDHFGEQRLFCDRLGCF